VRDSARPAGVACHWVPTLHVAYLQDAHILSFMHPIKKQPVYILRTINSACLCERSQYYCRTIEKRAVLTLRVSRSLRRVYRGWHVLVLHGPGAGRVALVTVRGLVALWLLLLRGVADRDVRRQHRVTERNTQSVKIKCQNYEQ